MLKIPEFLLNKNITNFITLDFETFYSVDYTLKKMSTSLYIFDEQFLVHGLGVILNNGKPKYFNNDKDIRDYLKTIDWNVTAVLGHHTQFDGLILSHHYGIVPKYYLDTLSMARPVLQNRTKSLNLDSICKYFNIEGKLEGLEDTKGKRTLTDPESTRLEVYCKNDIDITRQIFYKLLPEITVLELHVIHLTINMYANPKLVVDEDLIDKEIEAIQTHKAEMFNSVRELLPPEYKDLDVVSCLRSGDKLAKILEHNNIAPPKKTSPTTGLLTHAFARTDLAFQKLDDDSEPVGQLLYNARLTSKSDTALNKAVLLKKFALAGSCPIYGNYWNAQTGRWSGGDKWNPQNLPRGGAARLSLLAPEKHYLLVCDSSQIELRVSAWFAGQQDVLDVFNSGGDVYKTMASKIYNIDVSDVTKDQRMIGKVACLGLGYGCGVDTFDRMLKAGVMGPKVDLPREEVQRILDIYRRSNYHIVNAWRLAGKWLDTMCKGSTAISKKYKHITFPLGEGRADLPNGMSLIYHDMRLKDREVIYQGANGATRRIYSSLFYENIIQSLARHIMAEQMVKISERYDIVHTVHDEIIISVPEKEIDEATEFVEKEMRISPAWCKSLQLDCESGYAREYSK